MCVCVCVFGGGVLKCGVENGTDGLSEKQQYTHVTVQVEYEGADQQKCWYVLNCKADWCYEHVSFCAL